MRDRVAVVVAVALVVAVVGGGAWLLLGRETRDPQAEAEAAAAAWATAVEDEDWDRLGELAPQAPDGLSQTYADAWDTLGVTEASVEPGPVALDRASATTRLDVTLTIGELGEIAFDAPLRLVEGEEEWLVDWQPETLHPDYRLGRSFQREVSEPERAPILAADGTPLTEPGEIDVVGLHPVRMEDPQAVVDAFTEHVPEVDAARVEALVTRDDLRDDWFYPIVEIRDAQRFAEVRAALLPVPGVVFRTTPARLTPSEGFAAHVLGRTGEITAELLERLGPPYEVGDTVGLSGLELAFEGELAGTPRVELHLVDDAGDRRATLAEFPGSPPEPVRTTLDLAVQQAAEAALADVDRGALVAVDAGTGAIRAVVSRPLGEFNRALAGRYAPGSTFKVVTAVALLDSGLGVDSPVACPGEVVVGGLRVPNAGGLDLGEIPFRTAFSRSCNTTFAAQAADRLDDGDLAAAAATFGFDRELDLALPAFGGAFPTPDDLAERAAAAFGQARVQASPLQMATVAAVAASGTWREPSLLADAPGREADPLTSDHAAALRTMMRRVVTEGTGTAAEVAGDPVHGKTGSAQNTRDGQAFTDAWFIGFRGTLAFAVLVEAGESGGEAAAPLAARFLRALDGS